MKSRGSSSGSSSERGPMYTGCCLMPSFVSLIFLGALKLAAAQQPAPGFKSVDCGSSDPYTDPETTVYWVPDKNYINTGENVDNMPIPAGLNWAAIITSTTTQLQSLRRFPEKQSKHCYTFEGLVDNTQYLVRATFYHPNSSTEIGPLNHTISFQICIDSTVVEELEFTPDMADNRYAKEYIIQARSDTMYVCLIPGEGVPFINALEIRPLSSDTYVAAFTDVRAFLVLSWRMDCGVLSTDQTVRFPDDDYDRYWDPPPSSFNVWNFSSVSFDPNSRPKGWDWGQAGWNNPANAAMNTAWDFRSRNYSARFSIPFEHNQGYFAVYSVNLNASDNTAEKIRNFSWYIDEEYVTEASFNGGDGWQLWAKNWTMGQSTDGLHYFLFNSTKESVLGPILNAAEAYGVYVVNDVSTHPKDKSALKILKNIFNVLEKYTGDPCLPVPYDWLNCRKPSDDTQYRIVELNLNNMQLSGEIPKAIFDMTALEVLMLGGNQLTGRIPDFTPLQSLQSLHLESNSLFGQIPASLGDLPNLRELYLQNNSLCNDIPANVLQINTLRISNTTVSCTQTGESKSISVDVIIGVVLAIVVIASAALCVLLIIICLRKRRGARQRQRELRALGLQHSSNSFGSVKSTGPGMNATGNSFLSTSGSKEAALALNQKYIAVIAAPRDRSIHLVRSTPRTASITAFTYEEIQAISNNFAEMIGKGGYGPVYRGRLYTGQEVAIKLKAQESDQGTTEFCNEVQLLSRVHHKNILPLTGFCAESPHEILVYHYMSNGTLHQHLHGDSLNNKARSTLDWSTRVQIAQSAARGLDYLHTDALPKICHRDVKSSNILLDDDFSSKVGDFGISKSRKSDDIREQTLNCGLTTDVKGSWGYLDPEYFFSQRLTYASDVYSFGVVLFEIITGKHPHASPNLVEWAKKNLREGNMKAIVDPIILNRGKYTSEEGSLWRVADLAMLCTQERGTLRPTMGEVVHELTDIVRAHFPVEMTDTGSFHASESARMEHSFRYKEGR